MALLSKISTLAQTVRYLKPRQVGARVSHVLRRYLPVKAGWDRRFDLTVRDLAFAEAIPCADSFADGGFEFLNQKRYFAGRIDWEYPDYGRLWTYNLNYFEFINQKSISKDEALALIYDFADGIERRKTGMEPYPVSLRCMNWIRFFAGSGVKDDRLDSLLYAQLQLLARKLEYHLLGNHLLENGFTLLFGAYYFGDRRLYEKAKSILVPELEEQVLPDGAHFELSPMYHSVMLLRVLDCCNLIANNGSLFGGELGPLFERKGREMLGWLNAVAFRSGNIPLFNDAAFGVAPSAWELNEYAGRLGIVSGVAALRESGYRKFADERFEMVVDMGNVGPDYQPGHAHADTFGFELHINSRPILVDTGTSTYEVNGNRFFERSTGAHNTVVVGGRNSSEVWGGHRVARRARVKITEDTSSRISASHDGYRSAGVTHCRTFEAGGGGIVIKDELTGKKGANEGVAYFHFHPSETIQIEDGRIVGGDYVFSFEGAGISVALSRQYYAPQFNTRIENSVVAVGFERALTTRITIR